MAITYIHIWVLMRFAKHVCNVGNRRRQTWNELFVSCSITAAHYNLKEQVGVTLNISFYFIACDEPNTLKKVRLSMNYNTFGLHQTLSIMQFHWTLQEYSLNLTMCS